MYNIFIVYERYVMEYCFCEQIDRHLCFNRDYISPCTVGNNTKGQIIPIIKEHYKGELIDWYQYLWERKEIKEQAAQGNLPETCQNCQFLSCKEWDNINTRWEFQYIQFSHWLNCNSNCIYCGNHRTVNKKSTDDTYDSLPVLKDLIARGYVTENTEFDFAGGEPTMYYRFEEMLNILNNIDIKSVLVHTNAIIYSRAIAEGIKKGKVSLCISVDAGKKSTHEKIKGVKSYNKVWKNIKKYASYNTPSTSNFINLKYVLVPGQNDTEEEIELWMKQSAKYANMLILNADNNIFINPINPEKKDIIINKLYRLSEFFIKKSKEYHMNYRIEYNLQTVYIKLNKEVPENKR